MYDDNIKIYEHVLEHGFEARVLYRKQVLMAYTLPWTLRNIIIS